MKNYKHIRVCHFASVHTTDDTRVFHRECASMAAYFDVHLIAIGKQSGIIQGVHVTAIPKPASRIQRLLFTTWLVFFKALKVNARIYHIHDAELLPFGIVLSLLGKKVIYDIHENTYEDIRHKPWIPVYIKFIASRLYSFTEWLSSYFMHFILVIAKPELASCFHKRKFSIVQNYADTKTLAAYRINDRSTLGTRQLFYMGTVHDMYYDFNTVIDALILLHDRGMPMRLKVAGFSRTYEQNEFVKHPRYELAKSLVEFLGYQHPADAYKHSMDCMAGLCLKNQPAPILVSHERKLFEYMAMGLPFICCNSHIYTELLGRHKAGIAVDLTQAEDIANAIATMVTQPELLKQLQAAGIHAAETEYNWATQERILAELYQSLL